MRPVWVAVAATAWLSAQAPPTQPTAWRLNNLSQFADDRVEVIGAPSVVSTNLGRPCISTACLMVC